jgi:hypothetical protein
MKPIEVTVYVESDVAHTSQFFSGLYKLQDEGLVKVSLKGGNHSRLSVIRCKVNGTNVFIDLNDHANIDEKAYENNAFYFKRMLLTKDVATHLKLHPYGLNYPVYYKHDRSITRSLYSKDFKKILNTVVRSTSLLANTFNINLGHHTANVHHFEYPPTDAKDASVIFSARLWVPEKPKPQEKQQQRRFINEQRIAIVREGRKRLGDKFVGGIDIDDYAKQTAPDALVPNVDFSHKRTYLQALKNASIGIATAGLEDSIGFKFAEYIAMSKAIVTTPIDQFALPGNFSEGNNYVSFNHQAADCIDKCIQLLNDKQLLQQVMHNNYQYYQQYLRPDKLVWNILKTVADA